MSDTRRLVSATIRAAIRAAGEPQTAKQLAQRTGVALATVRTACFNMQREGVLVKNGAPHFVQRFSIGRDIAIPGYRVRQAANVISKQDARLAVALRKQERVAEKARGAAERLAAQEVREQLAAQRKQPGLSDMARSAVLRSEREQPSAQRRTQLARVAAQAETVDQWTARTGRKPVTLCRRATAEPFKNLRISE